MGRIIKAARVRADRGRDDEQGFTLVELLVAVVILPIVVGGLVALSLSVFRLQSSVSDRLTGSVDLQNASALMTRDVQNANFVTTSTSPLCGSKGTQILALRSTSSPVATVVSYDVVSSTTSGYQLWRQACVGASTTPSYSTIIAVNVPSNQSATVTCAATITCSVSSGWVATPGVASVAITVSEQHSGAGSPYATFSLSATPRNWSNAGAGIPSNPYPISPLTLINTGTCPQTVLSLAGSSIINVSGGSGNVQVNSACAPSIVLTGTTKINAASLATAASPASGSLSLANGGDTAPAPTYAAPIGDPLASALITPTNPSGLSAGSCTGSGTIVCTPGEYSGALSFAKGVTSVTFQAGNYQFDQPVSVTNIAVATFNSGTYRFEGGYTMGNSAIATFNKGTYIFEGTTSGTSPTSAINIGGNATMSTGTGGALFYIRSGTVAIGNGITASLAGETSNFGVAIWDAAPAGTSFSIGGGSTVNATYGGIYDPLGTVTTANGAIFSASFIVSNSAVLSGAAVVNVG